jgi:hypothetical protein
MSSEKLLEKLPTLMVATAIELDDIPVHLQADARAAMVAGPAANESRQRREASCQRDYELRPLKRGSLRPRRRRPLSLRLLSRERPKSEHVGTQRPGQAGKLLRRGAASLCRKPNLHKAQHDRDTKLRLGAHEARSPGRRPGIGTAWIIESEGAACRFVAEGVVTHHGFVSDTSGPRKAHRQILTGQSASSPSLVSSAADAPYLAAASLTG